MAIFLEQLEHQRKAIEAVLSAMQGCRSDISADETDDNAVYANPRIELDAGRLHAAKLPECSGGKNIDVKMETGTGKTYVYTRLMYELYKNFGLNKFIIFVPSLPIKEGTKNFITADYARQHFSTLYENLRIDLDIINSGSFNTKKGRKTLPSELLDYIEGSHNQQNTIKCLLLNDAMLLSKSMTRDDYDQTLFGGLSCPVESLKQTRPIVIIDEPHRFKKDGKAYQAIQKLEPQLIIRFGATFPDDRTGKKDYENLVYNLGSVRAFNEGLVKEINVHYPIADEGQIKYVVMDVLKREKKIVLARVGSRKEIEIKYDDSFPADFPGVELGLDDDNDLAINDMKLEKGMTLLPSIFSMSYQEVMLSHAINQHFEKEKANWLRENAGQNAPKIKTLSLFFIDSIKSYRSEDGWLKVKFETLLKEKLKKLIATEKDAQYKEFLQTTLANLRDAHAGYFAEDNGKGDEALQAEVDDILRNKEEMLSFKRKDGSWNIRRFLFSKWTLREGWDNPNVFVITKLRTSGSEISKLQEVGRGLRLPVDENGKRLNSEKFQLDYIIDWSERGFAEKLTGEINSDAPVSLDKGMVTDKTIKLILQSLGENVTEMSATAFAEKRNELLEKLDVAGAIRRDNSFKEGGYEKMLETFPQLEATLCVRKNIVTETFGNQKPERPKVKLRKENWDKIKNFWEQVTRRYMLEFTPLNPKELDEFLDSILSENKNNVEMIFVNSQVEIHTDHIRFTSDDDDVMMLMTGQSHHDSKLHTLPYGKFLSLIHKETCLPMQLLHQKIGAKLTKLESEGQNIRLLVNTKSAANFVNAFQREFQKVFAQKYVYRSLDFSAHTSVFTTDGALLPELEAGVVGTNEAKDIADDPRNLYNPPFRFDSDLEHDVLKLKAPPEVVVFGKLPRRSIKVPTYTGGTTTPDFVFAIKRKNEDNISLHLVVETKAQDLRGTEQVAIAAQKKLFEKILGVKWDMANVASDVSGMLQLLIERKTP